MKSFKITLSALAFSLLCNSAIAAERVSVAYLPTLHGLPLFVALEEGMFKNAGLEVTATKFENPNQIIDSLVAGRSDAAPSGGAAGITALAESRFPGVLRVFALQGSSSKHGAYSDAFIVQTDSPIQSIADLKGKRVVHAPGIQWRTIARTIFQANGMDPDKDVTLTEMAIGLHAQAVIAGTADAALALEPVPSVVASSGKIKSIVDNPAGQAIAEPFFSGAGIVTTKFLQERPEVAKKLMDIMDEAATKVRNDFQAYSKYLIGYTAVTPETIGMVKPMYFIGSAEITEDDIVAYQKFADTFVTAGAMKQAIDVNKLILRASDVKR